MTVSLKQLAASAAAVVALGTAVIAPFEGLRTKAYIPISGDVPTLCYGETLNVHMGDTATPEQCKAMLAKRVAEFYGTISLCMPADLPAASQAMFLSLAYNVGSGGLCHSNTIQAAFARHDYAAACNAITLFNRAGGKVVPGLVSRRASEKAQCLVGLKPN